MQPGVGKYFLALVPSSPVYEEALALKNYFKDRYASKAALRSPPHITLHMPFEYKLKKESVLREGLDRFAEKHSTFPIDLSGFSSFPPRVIYIDVMPGTQLVALQSELVRFCKIEFNLFNAQYKDQAFHPHLTVAFRDLKKPAFASAWVEFSTKEFSRRFEADGLVLLRHDGTKWVPIHRASFSKFV